jgi:hypothetical protein
MQLAGAARPGPLAGGGGGGGGAGYDEKALAITKLKNARAMKHEEIQGLAARQKQAADDATAKTAMQFGLDEQVREQEFDNELEAKREEARQEANQWELHYSPQQLQEVAKRNHSNQAIANDESLSPEEKATMTGINNDFIDNMQPGRKPADPNRWKGDPKKGPGMAWVNESGGMSKRDKDGVEALLLKPQEMPDYLEGQAKLKVEEAQQDRVQKREDDEEDRYYKRLSAVEDRLWESDTESGVSDEGKPTYAPRTPTQVRDELASWEQANPSPRRQREVQQEAAARQQAEVELDAHVEQLAPGEQFTDLDGNVHTKNAPPKRYWHGGLIPEGAPRSFGGLR